MCHSCEKQRMRRNRKRKEIGDCGGLVRQGSEGQLMDTASFWRDENALELDGSDAGQQC